jgi:hypothetical protein
MSSTFLKKMLVVFVFTFIMIHSICFSADYAIDKGSNMFGLTAGLINASGELYDKGSSTSAILLMPSYTNFLVRNLAVGGDLLFFHFNQGGSKISTLGAGPKAVFFFGGRDWKSYPYLTLGFYYATNTINYGTSDYTVLGTRFKLGGGASVMITSNLGLLIEGSYNWDNFKDEDTEKSLSGKMLIISLGLVGFKW